MAKEIIIDGVDVKECDFLVKEDDYDSYSGGYRAYKGECCCSEDEMCKDHSNCFYKKALKQLKRKEQECGKHKRQLFWAQNQINLKNEYIKKLQADLSAVRQENEKLKEKIKNDATAYKSEIDIWNMEYKKLQSEIQDLLEENEKLKEVTNEIEKFCHSTVQSGAVVVILGFIKQAKGEE